MSKYITEQRGGGYVITEIKWGMMRDSNKAYFHHTIEEAERDMDEMNELVGYYRSLRMVECV